MQAEPESNPPRRRPPFGIYAYTAREWDPEIGLYYYRARYYDPKVGRFISEDPIGFRGGKNLYAYAWNRPVQLRDPFGLCPEEKDDCFFYWVVVCWGCDCWEWSVPSMQCPKDEFHVPSKPRDVSPRYPFCSEDNFEKDTPNSDYRDTQMTPEEKPGNGPRDRPWEKGPPTMNIEILPGDPAFG